MMINKTLLILAMLLSTPVHADAMGGNIDCMIEASMAQAVQSNRISSGANAEESVQLAYEFATDEYRDRLIVSIGNVYLLFPSSVAPATVAESIYSVCMSDSI